MVTAFITFLSMASAQTGLIPAPLSLTSGKAIKLTQSLRIVNRIPSFESAIQAFKQDFQIEAKANPIAVTIIRSLELGDEVYKIDFGTTIRVSAASTTGLAWALQSLGQLIDRNQPIKVAKIHDAPAVPFRCLTMDVARRFHSISTLRTMVRWCQLGKVRYLQLHLTDDQNWMLPTSVLQGIDKRNQHGQPAYTKQELKELQAFASPRGVTIVPEIDIPGHSSLLVAHDPSTFKIQGSESTNCVNFGSPLVRHKLKQLNQETAQLFSESPYIHIGGDEAWYPNAEKDPQIKAAMGTASTNDVFVDFVSDMAQEVIRLDKTPIVWEGFGPSETAKKRIPKQAIVIAWEGNYYPPDQLLKEGFKVVNAGWDPNYVVNHFPYEAYTLVPLERLYQSSYKRFGIVDWASGVKTSIDLLASSQLQGSMLCWWEGHEWNAHRILPERIVTFGARLWNPAGETDYDGFKERYLGGFESVWRRSFPISASVYPGMDYDDTQIPNDEGYVQLSSTAKDVKFAWRTDGKIPTVADIRAQSKIPIKLDTVLTVQGFRGQESVGDTEFLSLHRVHPVENLAYECSVSTTCADDPEFGANRVTDGVSDLLSAHWIAYPNPQTLTIDLGTATDVGRIEVVAFWATGAPTKYRLALSSDNKSFATIVDASNQTAPSTKEGYVHRFTSRKARYVRIETLGSSLFPSTMTRINEIRVFKD